MMTFTVFFVIPTPVLIFTFVTVCCHRICKIRLWHFISTANSVSLSRFLSVQVSHAYRTMLITHVLIMPSFVWMLVCLPFRMFLNSPMTLVALATFLLISPLPLQFFSWFLYCSRCYLPASSPGTQTRNSSICCFQLPISVQYLSFCSPLFFFWCWSSVLLPCLLHLLFSSFF